MRLMPSGAVAMAPADRRRSAAAERRERIWAGLGGILIVVAYLSTYANDPATPGNSMQFPLGWFGWFDQSKYIASTRALAAGNLDPAQHWYPLGYAVFASLFSAIPTPALAPAWGHAFLLPDLLCFLAAYAGFMSFARCCGVGVSAAMPLFLFATIVSRPVLTVWAEPWNTTLSAAMIWWLLALTAKLRSDRFAAVLVRRRLMLAAVGMLVAAMAVTRPTDLLIVGCWALFFGLDALVLSRRALPRCADDLLWLALGAVAVLIPFARLYLRIYGPHPTQYMVQSRLLGFHLHGIGWKIYTLLVDPRPWYPAGVGMLQRLPWIALGIAGMMALPALARGQARTNLVLLTLLIVPYVLLFLSYTDLLPTGLWRFNNIHYFKWTLPGFALLGFVAVRTLLLGPGRPAVAIAFVAAWMLLSVRAMPVRVAAGAPAWLLQYSGPSPSFDLTYFGGAEIHDARGLQQNIMQFRALPDSQGFRLIALQDPFEGPVAFIAGDPIPGRPASVAPLRWGLAIGLGWPCWLPDYGCDGVRPLP